MLLSKIALTHSIHKGLSNPRDVLKALPGFAMKPFVYSPFALKKAALTRLLFELFKENLREGDMDFLQGRWLKLEVSDVGLALQFSCGPKREVLIRQHGQSDACIRGDLKSFIFLAARKEDPDTLFFQRSLVIEGDTNLGLEVKNLMDALDLDSLPPEITFGIRCGAEYMNSFC